MTDDANSVAEWLHRLSSPVKVSKKIQTVLSSLEAFPRLASYGTLREVAAKANASVSTIARTAQVLGFSGWPQFQEELRTVYISSLSAVEIIQHRRHGQERPSYAWLFRDFDNMGSFLRGVDIDKIVRIAEAIASANRTFVVGLGSYNGVGQVLAHSANLYGFDVRLLTEEGEISNTVAHLREGDLVITINFWRMYRKITAIIEACSEKGIPAVMLGENITREIEVQCFETIKIPSEAIGFSPSLTVLLSVVHAIVAELQAIDPDRSSRMIQEAEREWLRQGL